MRIAMFGTGYVGLVSGACFSDFGHVVTCIDKNAEKIRTLQKGKLPIFEPGLDALVASNVAAGRLSFASESAAAIRAAVGFYVNGERMATCPECDAEIEVDEFDVDKGDQLSCPECGSNLEVVALAPLELDLAPDDDDEEEEEEEDVDDDDVEADDDKEEDDDEDKDEDEGWDE